MPDRLVLGLVLGLALVLGPMAVVWYVRRRGTKSIDDPSILLAAPPEGLTPAVAGHVAGAPVHLSFIAALLDLASRGEIMFKEQPADPERVGIAIGGADLKDPRIERNRRRPAGEAEAWVLGQLELRAANPRHAPWDSDALADTNFPALIQVSESMLDAVVSDASQSPAEQDATAARQNREEGLLPGAQSATAQRSAKPVLHISAADALLLNTPVLFGTFLETYERRHGWLGAMPFITRLRWRILGVVAAGIGIALLAIGVDAFSDLETGLGVGVFFGGLIMFWRAPVMVQPTVEGGRIRAQMAAYRRTLQATLQSAGSIADFVKPSGLSWLSTPDQAIAWSVGLGLAPEVMRVLERSVSTGNAPETDSPAWFRPRHKATSAAKMFAAVLGIGGAVVNLPSFLRPMRSWWPS